MTIVKRFKELIFKNYLEKRLYMLGSSHFIKSRAYYKNIENLSDTEFKIYSQNGEDGILDYLIFSLGIKRPKFIEIGIGDYSESNSRFIFERTSPKGMVVDSIPDLENKIKKRIKIWKGDLKIVNKEINSNNVLDTIKKDKMMVDLDLFSIDIDGIDYWVLDKLPKFFSKIVVLEYNPTFGFELEVSVPNIPNFNRSLYHYSNLCFGMSFKAALNLMDKKGFYFVGSNFLKNNAFFISKKYKKKKYFKNLRIDKSKSNVDSNFRESRDLNNKLNYLSGNKKIKEIINCKVVNLGNKKKKIAKIRDLLSN